MPTFDHKNFLAAVTKQPGIYQMFNDDGKVLYVGKAKNLSNRLKSYFTGANNTKTLALVRQIATIEVTVTASEKEALFLEANLIKQHRPRYNILLKDDKAYPYLLISNHPQYPRLDLTRTRDPAKGETFGPYTSGSMVRNSITLLQKLFKLRPCKDSYFQARTRPCLQHQIERCSAPCVQLITADDYQEQLNRARRFLRGDGESLLVDLAAKMQQAASQRNFEEAAHIRDTLSELQKLQETQCIDLDAGNYECDIIAAALKAGIGCVSLMIVRGGQSLGAKAFYFSDLGDDISIVDLLEIFISQYYLASGRQYLIPNRLIVNAQLANQAVWEETLAEAAAHQVQIMRRLRQVERQWLAMTEENLKSALATQLKKQGALLEQFANLQQALKMGQPIRRIECFDISHTRGERTVASCVVFEQHGPLRRAYRTFNIEDITGGDDYAAMRQVLQRRYQALAKSGAPFPDLILIDGGKGQLSQAIAVLQQFNDKLESPPVLLGIAKGEKRISGKEELWLAGAKIPLMVAEHSQARHLIEQIRDEAHHLAITAHQKRRAKARVTSVLEQIPGLGRKRRQALLIHFGGLVQLKQASSAEIAKVKGISERLAKVIYQELQEQQ